MGILRNMDLYWKFFVILFTTSISYILIVEALKWILSITNLDIADNDETMSTLNPKLTWRTTIVFGYFQSEFEGICRSVLEKINKEWLYKSVRSIQQHQKQQNWGWTALSMKLESCRLSCSTMLRHKTTGLKLTSPEFVVWRSSCSKWLENFHEVALAIMYIVAPWICIFLTSQILPNFYKKCSFVCSFQQPYVHDIKYIRVL